MLRIGLWRQYINITNTFLDIIHRPVFYLKHNSSETGFCLRPQVKPMFGPNEYASYEHGDGMQSPKRRI
jgi:hypothetical protein